MIDGLAQTVLDGLRQPLEEEAETLPALLDGASRPVPAATATIRKVRRQPRLSAAHL
jgi:hypothetical protein